jgi:hypothetical protein
MVVTVLRRSTASPGILAPSKVLRSDDDRDRPARRRARRARGADRGYPAAGGDIPDAFLPSISARVGADHITTILGAPHSPQRTHPVETTAALLRALDS